MNEGRRFKSSQPDHIDWGPHVGPRTPENPCYGKDSRRFGPHRESCDFALCPDYDRMQPPKRHQQSPPRRKERPKSDRPDGARN